MKNFIIWTLHKYFWDDEIKKVTWAAHVVCMESTITKYEFLGGRAEGKQLLGSHKCVQKYDTKMYLKEMEKSGNLWTGFIWLRLGACDRPL